jgi:hypothetical protein
MKHMITLAFAGSALAISCCTSQVQAADQEFCRHYARSAVEQFEAAIGNPYCGHIGGLRWHANFGQHFGWCLGVPPWEAEREREARSHHLHHCMRG